MKPRILNKKRDVVSAQAIYIGRPSKWGNPFIIGEHGSRDDVIMKYAEWVCDQPALLAALPELRGRDLVCWCSPAWCHGNILRELANT